ncbi:MAG: phosphopantothenoylcysteine decarboxylase [Pirellulales bacterium]|nr:phosphopantothenoylcysteine decarboxylase [Pirellulales bacterium]
MPSEVLLGVTGGIAAYKTAALASDLVQSGVGVSVVMTRAATEFVGPATFRALTGRPVAIESFDPDHWPLGPHIELARQAQVLCVAPATADFLAKAANGLADDLLSTLWLSFTGTAIVAPAMNCEMWAKPAVQRNVAQLRHDGVAIVDPQEGWLSCRERGVGRMADPAEIAAAIRKAQPTS